MSAFEEFLRHNPQMAELPYGAGMAGTLSQASTALDNDSLSARIPARASQRQGLAAFS